MTDWSVPTELPDLRRADAIALDIETKDNRLAADMGSGWPFQDGHIAGLSAAYHAEGSIRGCYFPIRHPDTRNFAPERIYQWVRDLFASPARIITQHGLYDYGWLRREAGILMPPSERIEEIGALATMIDENLFKYSLDALCAWRGLPGKDDTLLRQGIEALGLHTNKRKKLVPQSYIWQLPARYVGPYAEKNAVDTLLLFEDLNPILNREGTRAAYRLECDILPMVQQMRLRGIRIDLDAAERARVFILGKRDAALAELSELLGCATGMDEIHARKWLVETFDRLGIKYQKTKKGNPSFSAGKLGWMAKHSHWLPRLIATANKYDKAVANFVQKLIDHTVNGRVHAEINPHRSEDSGTKSFRFSYSDPPLQQMPSRDEELAHLIRGVFLPEQGDEWATEDASQQEFRLVVHYAATAGLSKAAEAVARYRNDPDTDFHAHAATLTSLDRADAKAANFAKIYGSGPELFAGMIGKSVEQAKKIRAQYDHELPFVQQLDAMCRAHANSRGYSELYDGARRHWTYFEMRGVAWGKGSGPCPLEEAERRIADPNHPWYGRHGLRRAYTHTALNALIQGSAARHTKLWMRACWREGIVPLLQMHDALECSVGSREQAELVARLGCEAVRLNVPMRIDLKFGRNWADAKHSWEELHGTSAPSAVERPQSSGLINGHRVEPAPISDQPPIAVPQPAPEPEPETLEERLAKIPLADLVGEQPVHGKISCPLHDDDTPSMHIYFDHFHCFGCGVHGGHLDWLRDVEGLSPDAAIDVIFHWQGPPSPAARQESDTRTLELGLALWRAAGPITNTLASRYLAEVRGIDIAALPADVPLRFHPKCPFGPGRRLPCLLALYQDVESGEAAGIHRVAMPPEVFTGADVERLSLGRWPKPRVIKLWPATAVLYLGEGIETVLAAATRLPYRDGTPMRPAWAAGSTGGIRTFPVVPGVEELRLLLDHDFNGAGEISAEPCRDRWQSAGRKVVRLRPPQAGQDFNAVVLERLGLSP